MSERTLPLHCKKKKKNINRVSGEFIIYFFFNFLLIAFIRYHCKKNPSAFNFMSFGRVFKHKEKVEMYAHFYAILRNKLSVMLINCLILQWTIIEIRHGSFTSGNLCNILCTWLARTTKLFAHHNSHDFKRTNSY